VDKVRVVVVGYGMGAWHCKQISQVDDLALVGVCDIDPARREAAEAELGVKSYAALEQVLADPGVDLVVLAVAHHLHAPLTIQSLNADKHVVVEKAMCLNVKEADEMIAAARAAGRVLTVYQNRRGDSDYLTLRRVIDSGALGEVYQIECACNYRGPQSGWRARMEYGGGYIYDSGGHMIDQITQLAGCPAKTVFANLQRRLWTDTMDTETYANIVVRFENGLVGVIDLSGIYWYRKPRFVAMGEKGSFVGMADPNFGQFASACIKTEIAGLESTVSVDPLPKEDPTLYYRRLADHLLRGAELSVRPEDVRESIKIIQAAYESERTGQSVDVSNW